jgi:coenzyme F420-reducing hydrogenase gamma subunit
MTPDRPKIAFFDFTGCEGCQLTVLDSLQKHPELLNVVEIVQFREAMSEREDTYQIAFIEGSLSRVEDEDRLLTIRQNAALVYALGACAHLGGVNSQRNWVPDRKVSQIVYGEFGKLYPSVNAKPINSRIKIDGYVPGCPIDGDEFIQIVTALLQGRTLRLPEYPVCVECKLNQNYCLLANGVACLGPITRGGCNAICTTYGTGCDGCRGLVNIPNIHGLEFAFSEHGLSASDLQEKRKFFQSYQMLVEESD